MRVSEKLPVQNLLDLLIKRGADTNRKDADGREIVSYIEGNRDHPVNRGVLCAKGSAGIMQHYSPARLMKPLMRTGPRGSDLEGRQLLRDRGVGQGHVVGHAVALVRRIGLALDQRVQVLAALYVDVTVDLGGAEASDNGVDIEDGLGRPTPEPADGSCLVDLTSCEH